MPQSLAGVIAGLNASMATAFTSEVGTDEAPVLVSFGDPGQYQPSAIVAVMDVRGQISRPTMGTNRSREIAAEVDLIVSVYTPGDESAQRTSTDKAIALLGVAEAYVRTAPNETLGGACLDSWISAVASVVPSVAFDPASNAPTGRVTEITATLSARIRY